MNTYFSIILDLILLGILIYFFREVLVTTTRFRFGRYTPDSIIEMAENGDHYNMTKANDERTADEQNVCEVREDCVNEEVNSNRDNYNEESAYNLCLTLDLMKYNMEQLVNNTNSIQERIKRLDMICAELSQPVNNLFLLQKQLVKMKEIGSNLMKKFKELQE